MKADSLKQAIDYALGEPRVKYHIDFLEAQPRYFVVHQIGAELRDVQRSIIWVYINFYEAGNNNVSTEDLIVELQGTTYSNFKIIQIRQAQIQ